MNSVFSSCVALRVNGFRTRSLSGTWSLFDYSGRVCFRERMGVSREITVYAPYVLSANTLYYENLIRTTR